MKKTKNKHDADKHDADKHDADSIDESLKLIKFRLKNYDILKKEYDLVEENITPRNILRKMNEFLEEYIKNLVQIIQPEEFHSLHECVAFDDKEKAKMFDLYRNLMIIHREVLKAEIMNDDDDTFSTINLLHTELKNVKPEMLRIVEKLQATWKGDSVKHRVGYFG